MPGTIVAAPPRVGAVTEMIVFVSGVSMSVSLDRTLIVTAPPPSTATEASTCATGELFTPVTVTVTVADEVAPAASRMV